MRSRVTGAIAVALASAVCVVGAENADAQAPTVTANGNNTFTVPASVTASQVVTFMNVAGNHNVHFVGEPAGNPNPANAGAWSFTRAFPTPGAFVFYCDIHGSATTGMRGTLNVVAAPATPGTPAPAPTPATPTPIPTTPTTPTTDAVAPKATKVAASGTLTRAVVKLRLDEAATVTARLRRQGQTTTLKRVTRSLKPGDRQITLTRNLSAGRRYSVSMRIVDAAGNVSTKTVSFTARRPG